MLCVDWEERIGISERRSLMRSCHTVEGLTVHQLSFILWMTFDLDLLFLNVLQITGLSRRFQVAEYVYLVSAELTSSEILLVPFFCFL